MMLGSHIAIKSCLNNNYLSKSNDGKLCFDQKDIKNCEILILRYEGKYVTLKSKKYEKYLSLSAYNTLELDKNNVSDNERFEIEWLDDNIFSLKANNGLYISVQSNGKIEINKKSNYDKSEQFNITVNNKESLLEFLGF